MIIDYLYDQLWKLSGTEVIGKEQGLETVFKKVHRVAPTDSPVLLQGETGTGKEVVAHAIHSASRRKDKPFIKVNCGAIPENLIDSELFGHEKRIVYRSCHHKKRTIRTCSQRHNFFG